MKKKRFYVLYLHKGYEVAEVIEDLTLKSVISRYYESAGLTLLNENVKEVFPDVEFQFRKEAA